MRLTKAQIKQKEDLAARLAARSADVGAEFRKLLTLLPVLAEPVNRAIRELNKTLSEAATFRSGIADDFRSEFEDKSERWRDGDAGQAAESFISDWEEAVFYPFPEVAIIEPELEEDMTWAQKLISLPTESE